MMRRRLVVSDFWHQIRNQEKNLVQIRSKYPCVKFSLEMVYTLSGPLSVRGYLSGNVFCAEVTVPVTSKSVSPAWQLARIGLPWHEQGHSSDLEMQRHFETHYVEYCSPIPYTLEQTTLKSGVHRPLRPVGIILLRRPLPGTILLSWYSLLRRRFSPSL